MTFLILVLSMGMSYGDVNNILVNPGFESGTSGWSPRGGSFATVSSSPSPHSGSLSGRAYSRTGTWNGIQQSVLNKMVVGQTYNVSGWVRTASPSTTIILTLEKTDNGGTNYIWAASGTASNTSWTYISGSYTLTANGTITALNFYVESLDLNDIYLDDANIILPPLADPNATGNVNFNVTHQKLEGFGASAAWYEGWLEAIPEPNRTNLYNTLFRDLGLDIFRIRNTYDYDSGYMSNIRTIVSKALARNPNLKILCSSWSPPTYLKSTGA